MPSLRRTALLYADTDQHSPDEDTTTTTVLIAENHLRTVTTPPNSRQRTTDTSLLTSGTSKQKTTLQGHISAALMVVEELQRHPSIVHSDVLLCEGRGLDGDGKIPVAITTTMDELQCDLPEADLESAVTLATATPLIQCVYYYDKRKCAQGTCLRTTSTTAPRTVLLDGYVVTSDYPKVSHTTTKRPTDVQLPDLVITYGTTVPRTITIFSLVLERTIPRRTQQEQLPTIRTRTTTTNARLYTD